MSTAHTYVADRDALFADIEHYMQDHQQRDKKFAVILVNINHFRQINLAYGYQMGDQLLEGFAGRLRELARDQDYIARMGNSEFILVLPEILNIGHATLAANKISRALGVPFDMGTRQQKITVNMGVAIFPDHAAELIKLIQCAEKALMQARQSVELFAIYAHRQESDDIEAWDIESQLSDAHERDEFEMYFQPQVNLKTGELFGTEALIRWNHPEQGFIRPDLFIPIAENSGHIHKITWWTINAALRLLNDWPETSVPLKVAVNLSARVLPDPNLVDSVRSALSIWGTAEGRLTLEITESALMQDMSTSFITLDELRSLGVNISIDDFGTGYSSMAYFKYIPANELKIDQSFVRHMLENSMDQHIVKTVIEMAHGFDIDVVAEGVEDIGTLKALKQLDCDVMQGFYLAKPMSQENFINWLKGYHPEQFGIE